MAKKTDKPRNVPRIDDPTAAFPIGVLAGLGEDDSQEGATPSPPRPAREAAPRKAPAPPEASPAPLGKGARRAPDALPTATARSISSEGDRRPKAEASIHFGWVLLSLGVGGGAAAALASAVLVMWYLAS